MTGAAQATLLADGRRLHLHHGPIDIIAQAFGKPAAIRRAYRQAADRFRTILAELVEELPLLRRPMTDDGIPVEGVVARRMTAAVWPHRKTFITPMAAVAGAAADEVLAAMVAGCPLAKAYVNDGGDIAWHLAPGESLRAGIVANQDMPAIDGAALLDYGMPVRGLATSGWRGRSCSLGIADAVTVLAESAAQADAAATLVANAVDCAHPAIVRTPANQLHDDTDLGELLVTVAVAPLPEHLVAQALERGAACATAMREAGLIYAASLLLQGQSRIVQPELPARTVLADGKGTMADWTCVDGADVMPDDEEVQGLRPSM
jgi:ApbE superfamily uncharacterized protein (UPF0280 family)